MAQTQKQQGFTIIEVVLVLAIAGLIFLMVFIALPALQRGQRDTQRRDDASRFISQLNSYQTNHNGNIPSGSTVNTTFKKDYMKSDDGEFQDPESGDTYQIVTSGTPSTKKFVYSVGKKCTDGELDDGTGRSAAIQIKLEGSGTFCADNQ